MIVVPRGGPGLRWRRRRMRRRGRGWLGLVGRTRMGVNMFLKG